MTPDECRVFRAENMEVPNKEVRLKILQMSKEDMWDYMDWHESELIHGWRERLTATEASLKDLKTYLSDTLEYGIDYESLRARVAIYREEIRKKNLGPLK